MEMSLRERELATQPIGKLLIKLTIPTILAQVVNALYNIVDRMYITNIPDIGGKALTGVGLTFPIIMIISAFAGLIGMGGAPLVSIALGEKNTEKAKKILGNAISLLVLISVVLTAVLMFTNEDIIRMFGSSDDTLPFATQYMSVYLIGTLAVQLTLGLSPFLTAQGFAKFTMITVLIGAGTNILLDPLFIFTFGLGVKGAALATVISQLCSAIFVVVFLFSKKPLVRIEKKYLSFWSSDTIKILALGISPFIMQITESFLQICYSVNLKQFGTDDHVGAIVILNSIMQMFTLPIMGFAQGAQPIVGYNYGAGNYDRVKKTVKYMVIVCFVGSFLSGVLGVVFPEVMCSVFAKEQSQFEVAVHASRLFFAGFAIFGLQSAFQNTFIALGQAKISIFLAVLRKVILLIPLIIILPRFTNLGTDGIFLSETIADSLSAITSTVCFAFVAKKLLVNKTSLN